MRKNRISIFSQILYGISKETIQRRTIKEVQNLYQTDTNIKPRKWNKGRKYGTKNVNIEPKSEYASKNINMEPRRLMWSQKH